MSTALSFLICKNHKVVVKIMDYAQHCTWTHAKGSVVERRKPAMVTLWCHCPDSLRQWSDTFTGQSNDLNDKWDAKQKFTWETWPLCPLLPVLFSTGDLSIPEEFPLLSFNYLSDAFVFSDMCGRYKFMGSFPRNASGQVIQQGPFKASTLKSRNWFPLQPLLSHLPGFLGLPYSAGLMTFDTDRCKAN